MEKKIKKIEIFFCGAPDAPEDQAICLFAGLLANPDMPLSHDWYDSDKNLQIPLLDAHGAHGISFQNLTGGYGVIFSDSFDEVVWTYFKPADGETVETITSTIAELQKFGPGFMIWNYQDRTFEVYFGDTGMQAFQIQQGELPPQAQRNLTVFVDTNTGQENLLDATRLVVEMLPDYRIAIEREMFQLVDFQIVDSERLCTSFPSTLRTL